MCSTKSVNCLLIWNLFLFLKSFLALSLDKELPSFVELPPPIQYYVSDASSVELKCNVWPSSANIKFVVSSQKSPQNNIELTSLYPNIGEFISSGKLRITNLVHLSNIKAVNIHCLVATDFATILSRPFRVTPAGISDFGNDSSSNSKTVEKTFLRGNVAIIDCFPPVSNPKAEVKFNFNGVTITDGGKYRVINWPDGKRMSLLIHPAEQTDNGMYKCTATNPVTRQTVTSEVTNLKVEVPQTSIPPTIITPISGRTIGPQTLFARKGMNITLFCVMQGAPPPRIQIYNYNNDLTSSSRYSMDREFGLLKIMDVGVSDAGSYMCSDKIMTNSAVLKVIEPLNITTRPIDVVLEDLFGSSAKFDCVLSRTAIIVQWFFNGTPLKTVTAQPAIQIAQDGSLNIAAVTSHHFGIYQCVAQDNEEWVSAWATLSLKSHKLRSQFSEQLANLVQVPVVQNVDKQERIISVANVSRIHDNIAVYLSWKVNNHNLGLVTYFVLQYKSKGRTDAKWSTHVTIQEKVNVTYYYVTNRYLKPQNSYRFRVHMFFTNGHTITSNWSKDINFFNVGNVAPIIMDSSVMRPGTIGLQWSYNSVDQWPVDTFRVLYRREIVNRTSSTKKFDRYSMVEVMFPAMNVTIGNLEPGSTYQLTVYGISGRSDSRTITLYSPMHTVSLPSVTKTVSNTTPSSTSRFFAGLLESWKSNKLLYGCLFAITGFLILVMFLLLILCLCRQKRFRKNKDTSSSHTFPYSYKEVNKTPSLSNNNNSSTLQIPGRMPQYSSQLGLQQFQHNTGSMDRQTDDTTSQIHRAGSSQAMETTSLVSDLYNPNYISGMTMSHMQHPHPGFSTLPQGYASKNNPQYQQFLQQQQQQHQHQHQQQMALMNSIRRETPTGDSNRDSMIDQSMDPKSRGMSASQQQLMMMMMNQSQDQQRANPVYYNSRPGAISPQMMMTMMGSQQSIEPYVPYRRTSNSNYQGHAETSIAISATGQPLYQMDQLLVDPSGRPISPQYQYMQQQQAAQLDTLHPSMIDMYNQTHGYIRPGTADYGQQSLYRQQYRRSDSDCSGTEPNYSYLPTNHGPDGLTTSRQHTLNSLPEQPIDLCNSKQQSQDQHDSPGNMATNHSNNNSTGRHHHRRKTRNRQQNTPDNPSLERIQSNNGEIPPMLAPRSKMPYPDNVNTADSHDISMCNSDSNLTADNNCEPPLQYSVNYDDDDYQHQHHHHHHDPNDNDATATNNSLFIENLPRMRDVSEYGIPTNNNVRPMKPPHQHPQAPVPPSKSLTRHNGANNNNNNNGMDCNPDYYSSATSSDRSGPSPPPKYGHGNVAAASGPNPRQDDPHHYMKNMYYHGDTHC